VHFVQSTKRTRLQDLADLKSRIIAAVKNIDALMLTRVWQELEYRIDVCRVTSGAHIEHLQLGKIFGFLVTNVCNHEEHY